jgi:hypothetical protein
MAKSDKEKSPTARPGTQACWFAASEAAVLLTGGIFLQTDGAGKKPMREVVVRGGTSTPFVLPPGKYRYEFNVVNSDPFGLKLYIHGVAVPCKPAKFDPGSDGTVDLVTLFEIK